MAFILSLHLSRRKAGPQPQRQDSHSLGCTHQRGHATTHFLEGFLQQGPLNGGVSNGGVSRSGLVLPFFVLFCPFGIFPGIFPIWSGMVRGFSRFVLFLFLGLLRAPTRNSPERVRDTIWTFPPKKVGNTRVWKPPGLASLNYNTLQKKCLEGFLEGAL